MMRGGRTRKKPIVKTPYFSFDGGLNLVDPPLATPDGMLLGVSNYELLVRGGYRRIDGIERFDGQDSPSEQSYWILNYTTGAVGEPAADETVTGAGGATGKIGTVVVTSGTWAGGDAVGYLVIFIVSGTFIDTEVLTCSGGGTAIANGTAVISNADTDTLDTAYYQAAMEAQRILLLEVPGFGPVRGVQEYNAEVYAFRDNVGETACIMYKATVTGWVAQSLGNRVSFTLGTNEFIEGETLTQTGTTSIINRVVVQSGDWSSNDAVGYFIIGSVTSGPYSSGPATSASGNATLSGAEVANTLLPGGRYEFDNYNFFATSGTFRMYGVDGVNPAFEWDGSVYVPILTGNTNDTPHHLSAHKFHLFLAFEKGSLQRSATGNPYIWAGGGAGEIGTGDILVGLEVEVGNTLAVLCRNRSRMLYGSLDTGTDPWDLKTISNEGGGIEWTMQRIGETKYLDDRGFTTLQAVLDYGDFKAGVYSQLIEPLILSKKRNVVSSLVVKSKNQYRLFFDDGSGISATFDNNKIKGFTEFEYYYGAGLPLVVHCTANGEDANGGEVVFIGANDGYVYQVDKGTSMDGKPVAAFMRLSFSHMKSPQIIKQFLKVIFEVAGKGTATFQFTPDFDFSARDDITQDLSIEAAGGYWNIDNWNEFIWSGAAVGDPEAYTAGSGKNIGISIYHESTYDEPYVLYGATVHYEQRRRQR